MSWSRNHLKTRCIIAIILGLTLAAFLAGCGEKTTGSSNGVVSISVWHPWGGSQKERLAEVVEEFNRTHPNIKVRAVFTPNDLDSNQKFFTSVAANKPPDAIFVDGPQVAAWAEQGAIQPLDDYIAQSAIKPTDYFAPCWEQTSYRGKIWAMTYCADPNFAFAWNKKVFRDCGLDPEKPPTTIEELDKFNDRITKIESGRIIRIGIIPWAQFGNANATFTWGWAFGGGFYDPVAHKITANDPKVVKAMEWMTSYARKYDPNKINAFTQGFGSRDQNPFYIGRIAMQCLHISQIDDINTYAPDLNYGLTFIPAPSTGEMHSSWVGGWCLGIPKGSKHPKEAWEFIRWCCRDPKGTEAVGRLQSLLPGYRKSPFLDEVRKRRGYSQFLDILEACRHQRPVMPAQSFYMGSLERAVDYCIYGKMTPKQALDASALETQTELDLRLAGR
jgi:multiple sugar transport system substrate-binding protein